jgi:nucleoporin NUP82
LQTIKTQVAEDIRQLIISPHANYIAILTTHTVHVAILPEPSLLTAADTAPMKLKYYTLGPTTHVTSQWGIASALWHPLGVNGTCLVTVTEDAIVRLWELSSADRWSFDRPTLAIDLKKLADGTSVDQDFGASVHGTSKGFSPDSFEMEVASACFAGRGSGGWSPMTLWIAMREGDVYALCPLLPEKWSPPPTLIPSLSVSIVAKVAALEDEQGASPQSKLLAQQQLEWMSEIDNQEPLHSEGPPGEPPAEVYTRPGKPGRVPKLQGPFDLDLAPEESEDELDGLLSDICVIGPKMDADELMFGEEDDLELDEVDQEGLSVGIVCLLTTSGRLSVCLDLDGVEAQWLPKAKEKRLRFVEDSDPPSLLTFEVLDTSRGLEVWEGNWPVFSHDVNSRYSFYITNTSSVTFISLTPWVFRLETELNEATAGTDFRIGLLAQGQSSLRERLLTQNSNDKSTPLAASAVIRDPDLGYFLLTATSHGPIALTFEAPDIHFDLDRRSRSPTYDPEPDKPLIFFEPRPCYEPAHTLEQSSAMPTFIERQRHGKYKRLLQEEVRLSPATLTIITEAHKVISEETHRVGTAAAELFRRCEKLQLDLKNHIHKARDVATRIKAITSDDVEDGQSVIAANEKVEKRIHAARERQTELNNRIEDVRRKATRGSNRELSDKEKAWIDEVQTLDNKTDTKQAGGNALAKNSKEPWERFNEVKMLKEKLLAEINGMEGEDEVATPQNVKVPSEIRKAKMAQVMGLLDRESALVEAAKNRLERLSLS